MWSVLPTLHARWRMRTHSPARTKQSVAAIHGRRRAAASSAAMSALLFCPADLRVASVPLAVRARPRSAPQPLRCLPRTVWCSVLGCMVSVVTMSRRTGPFSLCGDLESLGLSVVRSHPV